MKHFEHPLKHKPSELLWRMMLAFSVFLFVCGLVLSPWGTLLPGLAALGLTFLCMWLLNKKVNALWIILGMFAVGIAGAATGFLGL